AAARSTAAARTAPRNSRQMLGSAIHCHQCVYQRQRAFEGTMKKAVDLFLQMRKELDMSKSCLMVRVRSFDVLRMVLAALSLATMLVGIDGGSAMGSNIAGRVNDVFSIDDLVVVGVTDYYHTYVAPACATLGGFAFDTNTQGGRNKLAIALAAKNSGHHLGIV